MLKIIGFAFLLLGGTLVVLSSLRGPLFDYIPHPFYRTEAVPLKIPIAVTFEDPYATPETDAAFAERDRLFDELQIVYDEARERGDVETMQEVCDKMEEINARTNAIYDESKRRQ